MYIWRLLNFWDFGHPPSASMQASYVSICNLRLRWTKRWSPGSVNMRSKNCVLLPAAGRRTQLFHLIFTEPGAHLLVHPCTVFLVKIFRHWRNVVSLPLRQYILAISPAVPMLRIEISPKYEPAFRVARIVFPSSATTSKRPLAQMYISFPTSPRI